VYHLSRKQETCRDNLKGQLGQLLFLAMKQNSIADLVGVAFETPSPRLPFATSTAARHTQEEKRRRYLSCDCISGVETTQPWAHMKLHEALEFATVLLRWV